MIPLLLGTIGMACILIAFVLDEYYKKYNQDTIVYNLLNILGAGLLLYYAFVLNGWPFIILNSIWLLVAGMKLLKILGKI